MRPTLITDDMRYWCVAPDPRLRAQVVCYWMVEATEQSHRRPVSDAQALMIPDGHSEIVMNRGPGTFERWKLDTPRAAEIMRGSYVIGGRSHSVSTRSLAPLSLAGVKLDPRFLRLITGVPLDEFRDQTAALADLGRGELHTLEQQVAAARDAKAIVALLDGFLLRHLEARRATSAVDALSRRIRETRGAVGILQWAREAGVDLRQLERSFTRAFGMTPKKYARVIRFKHLYRRVFAAGAPRRPLARQIDDCYDQSHFIREFRHFTGHAPGALLNGGCRDHLSVADHLLECED